MAIKTTAVNDGASTNINYAYWEKYQQQKAAEAAAKAAAAKEVGKTINSKQISTDKQAATPKKTTGTGTAAATATEPVTTETTTTPTYRGSSGGSAPKTEDPGIDMTGITSAYQNAMNVLKEAEKGQPIYDGSYDDQIAEIMGKITGRGKFEYDLSADGLYQQYKDQYMLGAKNAMRDTMGQAAALTGGYGSSYGQMVGQQAYDQQLQQLNNVVPELYGMAYNMYQDEGNRLFDELGMFMDMEQLAYDRHTDDYNRWLTERSYADAKAQEALAMQDENLTRLEYLISLGYKPTAQEIADAGLNLDMYKAIAAQYAPKKSGGIVYTEPPETGGEGYTWQDVLADIDGMNQANDTNQKKTEYIVSIAKDMALTEDDELALMRRAGLAK